MWLAHFHAKRSQEEEKRGFIYARAEYYLQLTQLDAIVHEQTIICGQLVICIASSDK